MAVCTVLTAVPGRIEMACAVLHHGHGAQRARVLGEATGSCLQQVAVDKRRQVEALLVVGYIVCSAVDHDVWRSGLDIAPHCQPVAGPRIDAPVIRVEPLGRRRLRTGFGRARDIAGVPTLIGGSVSPGLSGTLLIVVEHEVRGASRVGCPRAVNGLDELGRRIAGCLSASARGELSGVGNCNVVYAAECPRHASDNSVSVVWTCFTGTGAIAADRDKAPVIEPFGETGQRDVGEQSLKSIRAPIIATGARVRRRAWIRADRRARACYARSDTEQTHDKDQHEADREEFRAHFISDVKSG